MSRTFVRQDIQIRPSVTYDDTVAPTEAAFETNTSHIEDDLNNLRSQVHNLLDDRSSNWFSDLNIPASLETGLQRGVNDLNTDLHALEKKRVLRAVKLLTDVVVTASTAAAGVLTLTANAANTETVTTGSKVYTFQTVLTDVDGNVLIGAAATDSIDNLIAAINLGAGSGSLYAATTTANPSLSAAAGGGDTMDATALAEGTQGNSVATTETLTNGSWGAVTLTGGAGGDVEILVTGELPSQTTAAVGAVTTLGTVVATAVAFGTAGLDEVTGLHALAPKNLVEIFDGNTGDPFLTIGTGESPASKRIWGLLQGESGVTDGVTITDTTATRVQISFVIANATNDDLILVDGEEMGGKTFIYCYRERIRLEDFTEGDFLNSAAIDIGVGVVDVKRQLAYDNQGTVPVDLTTNATLDLEGPGLSWVIRDDLEQTLFAITEGSGGGTSDILISSDVDTFDVDAADNDFLNGVSVDTGSAGTTLNLGVTANQIDSGGELTVQSGGAGDLTLESATADLRFTDSNEPVGWSLDGISLSTNAATWTTFESLFGEVSLMEGIIEAAKKENRTKGVAVVTAVTIAADTNVTGAGMSSNIDAQLPDYSAVDAFVDDVDVFLNGILMRNGANAAANHDVYPGDTAADGDLKFEFLIRGTGADADVITSIVWGE